jgi:hypothetical protein
MGGESTKARSKKNSIGTYKTRSGSFKSVKPLTHSQQRKYPKKSEKWNKIPRYTLERQLRVFKGIGVFFGFWGFMMLISLMFIRSFYVLITLMVFGLIFLIAGGTAYSGGSFRRKYLVLTEEEAKIETPEVDIAAIAERFLNNP